MNSWRSFAIVPAAGNSLRMGQAKLLLPWRGRLVIEQTLAAWSAGGVTRTIVVIRPDDMALAQISRQSGADVVTPPLPPPEMKDSIRIALEHVAENYRPAATDAWLLAPADMPWLSPEVIGQLLAAHQPSTPRILVPVQDSRRGHPVLFPWPLAAQVATLSPREGVNAILDRHTWTPIPVAAGIIHGDLDTPEDYQRLLSHPPK